MARLFAYITHARTSNTGIYQFFKFGITGVTAAVIDFSIFLALTRVVHLREIPSNLISVFIATCFTFVVNKFWTFRNKSRSEMHTQSLKFFTIAAINYGLQQLILYIVIFHTPLHLVLGSYDDLGGKVIAVAIVMFNSFFSNKYWTFRTHAVAAENPATPPSQGA